MSRKGNCWDNAPMESFFGSLKTELDGDGPFETRQAARTALFRAIEGQHNRQRLHSSIGYITPVNKEELAAAEQAVTRVHRNGGWSDGDGFCEVHVNTIEGFWSLLRSWLRPHRCISQDKLPLYLSFFQFVHNARRRGKALLGALLTGLVA